MDSNTDGVSLFSIFSRNRMEIISFLTPYLVSNAKAKSSSSCKRTIDTAESVDVDEKVCACILALAKSLGILKCELI